MAGFMMILKRRMLSKAYAQWKSGVKCYTVNFVKCCMAINRHYKTQFQQMNNRKEEVWQAQRWGRIHNLLLEGGLTYNAISESLAKSTVAFTDGVFELLEFLEARDIHVLIFSAGIIEEVLRLKLHRSFKNVKVVSNRVVFDNDALISFKGPPNIEL
ncbi:uncharacterized protein LOC126667127 isoform X2 [Mercurialis annua]|uniref:uncharacterized protein LOC126667127 isoform X2 n=1 Tax=Mercurialis annua TaxID=3986 RepID=UPI0024AD5C7D|nr:uncharacterized protein LOC126667127 isoform X2 [Mercurialis annua]